MFSDSVSLKMGFQMTNAIILCAGKGERWMNHLGLRKQLAPCGDTNILARIVEMVRPRVDNLYIVSETPFDGIEEELMRRPDACRLVLDSLLSSKSYWGDKTIILLGDVFYSSSCIDRMLECSSSEIQFFGRPRKSKYTAKPWAELFGLVFPSQQSGELEKHASQVIAEEKAGNGRGKLWELYRSLTGVPLLEHQIEESHFRKVIDWTDDFDAPEEYTKNLQACINLENSRGLKLKGYQTFYRLRSSFRRRIRKAKKTGASLKRRLARLKKS